jgi:SAM-dependent methyltransferase
MQDLDDDAGLRWLREAFDGAIRDMRRGRWAEEVLARVIDGFVAERIGATPAAAAAEAYRPPEGSFDYISIPIPRLLAALHELDGVLAEDPDYAVRGARYRPVRFLEIGCGPGRNLFVIRQGSPLLWSDLAGIDIAAPLLEAGRAAFGFGQSLIEADARAFDYAPYDVVFSYRPFTDDATQEALEAHIERSMKVGAYLYAPLAINRAPSHRMLQVRDTGELWKKIG